MEVPPIDDDSAFLRIHDLAREARVGSELLELADGSEVLLFGDTEAGKDYFHKQGDNEFGFEGTCGLTSCGDVLNQYGYEITENDVVRHAVENGECAIVPGHPEMCGGTTCADQAQVLSDLGIPAHIEVGNSLEGLAEKLDQGHAAIIEVNAGELWENAAYYDSGQPNHAVTLRGVLKDPDTGLISGIVINDSGRGDRNRILPADHPTVSNWLSTGGIAVVTNLPK